MTFGEKIHARRDELGITLKQLSERVGVTEATVQRYESGRIRTPQRSRIAAIAQALGVDVNYLLGTADGVEAIVHDRSQITVNDFEASLLQSYRAMQGAPKAAMRDLILDYQHTQLIIARLEQHIQCAEQFISDNFLDAQWEEYKQNDDNFQFWCSDSD